MKIATLRTSHPDERYRHFASGFLRLFQSDRRTIK